MRYMYVCIDIIYIFNIIYFLFAFSESLSSKIPIGCPLSGINLEKEVWLG